MATSKTNAPFDDDLPTLPGHLVTTEFFWRDHYTWLKERGYTLRPRYAPGWVPSWEQQEASKGAPVKPFYRCEDGQMSARANVLDATRISDGAYMSLKAVEKSLHPYEAEIGLFLSKEPLASDIHNHCVPILDILQVPDDEDRIIIVMPMLRRYDNPRFDTFGEAVDFFRQVFEGMQFMHRNHVAHRDSMALNIMMDPSKLYPQSYHPRRIDKSRDFNGTARHTTRTKQPPKYYFIDFGLSGRYNPENGPPLEYPIRGGDKTVPEFRDLERPCNPFPTDIYYIGNMIRQDFLQRRLGFDFMTRLVADMVQDDPAKRPTIDEVVSRFDDIQHGLSSWKLRSRVVKTNDNGLVGFFRSIGHWSRRVQYIVARVPSVPSQ